MKAPKKEKNKEPGVANWKKALAVGVGVLFVVLMVVSSMGMSWISGIAPAKPGDTATLLYTVYDDQGRAVLTTDQRIFNTTWGKSNIVFLAAPIQMVVNSTTQDLFAPMPAQLPKTGEVQFAMLGAEANLISQGLVGMRTGETKRISLDVGDPMETDITKDQFSQMFGNTTAQVVQGTQFIRVLTDQPAINLDPNVTLPEYYRVFYFKSINPDGYTMKYGYANADVTLYRLNGR